MSHTTSPASRSVTLSPGPITYLDRGPTASTLPPVLFVHGFLVDGSLWSDVAGRLATQGIRTLTPTWPLGSHTVPMSPDADLSPGGVAALILEFLGALDLYDVTLVGSDTGGAICQFVIDADDSRIGRLVLTNCDAFELFPPPEFAPVAKLGRHPRLLRLLMAAMTFTPVRQTRGYGSVFTHPPDPGLTRRWIDPALQSRSVCNDAAKVLRGMHPEATLAVASRFWAFTKPVHLVWGDSDVFFPLELAHRLREAFPNASLTPIPGARTFVSMEHPAEVARVIAAATLESG